MSGFEWEEIGQHREENLFGGTLAFQQSARARVNGGWLYRELFVGHGVGATVGLEFVPDLRPPARAQLVPDHVLGADLAEVVAKASGVVGRLRERMPTLQARFHALKRAGYSLEQAQKENDPEAVAAAIRASSAGARELLENCEKLAHLLMRCEEILRWAGATA